MTILSWAGGVGPAGVEVVADVVVVVVVVVSSSPHPVSSSGANSMVITQIPIRVIKSLFFIFVLLNIFLGQ
jgi:hypothetical protein